jgi:hypothetical protein
VYILFIHPPSASLLRVVAAHIYSSHFLCLLFGT